MNLKDFDFWRYAGLTIAIVGTANIFFAWLLFNTHFGQNMPIEMKVANPIFTFIVTVWFFLAKRPRNLTDLFKK